MVPLTTHVFELTTAASSEDVWRALTDGRSRHLHGLELVSDWRPGSPVEALGGNGHALRGEVLVADAPHRLSLLFEGAGSWAIHLTWEIAAAPGPIVVRLCVDEVDGDTAEEAAEVWAPVVAALREALTPLVEAGGLPGRPEALHADAFDGQAGFGQQDGDGVAEAG
jgi:uncharacterized protein YndB with AHSA1/START domain